MEIKRKLIRIIAVMIMIMIAVMPAASVSAFAFSANESRSVQNFFIDAELLKGDGTSYGLEKTASRLEGTIILIRLMGKEAEAQGMKDLPCQFTDVPDWAKGYVNYAYSENISKGVSDTRFGVNGRMTASQYNTLLLRVLGYDDSRGDFRWDDSVDKAEELSILPEDMAEVYAHSDVYTKGDLMETSFCYLEAKYKDQDRTLIDMLIETGVVSGELAKKYGLAVKGWRSVTTGFDEDDYLTFRLSDNELTITGTSEDQNKTYLLVQINNVETGVKRADKVGRINSDGRYDISLSVGRLPEGEYYVDVYGNDERYQYYTSVVLSCLILKKTGSDIYFEAPPVFGGNLRIHNGNERSDLDNRFTSSTASTEQFSAVITGLAEKITAGIDDDYEKLQAIHDWVAGEIYYDKDYLNGKTKRTNINSIAVLENKYAVCSGYSNLLHDLLVASGIPDRQVIGYARGVTSESGWDELDLREIEANHVWNEAYVDGRWVILDATWDSTNKYEGGTFTKGDGVSRLYFDVSVPFLSNTHMTMIP